MIELSYYGVPEYIEDSKLYIDNPEEVITIISQNKDVILKNCLNTKG